MLKHISLFKITSDISSSSKLYQEVILYQWKCQGVPCTLWCLEWSHLSVSHTCSLLSLGQEVWIFGTPVHHLAQSLGNIMWFMNYIFWNQLNQALYYVQIFQSLIILFHIHWKVLCWWKWKWKSVASDSAIPWTNTVHGIP